MITKDIGVCEGNLVTYNDLNILPVIYKVRGGLVKTWIWFPNSISLEIKSLISHMLTISRPCFRQGTIDSDSGKSLHSSIMAPARKKPPLKKPRARASSSNASGSDRLSF